MPLARVAVSVSVEDQKKKEILKQLSSTLSGTIGKPEKYVQTVFEPGVQMTFAGTFEPTASVEIKSIGNLTPSICNKLSESCCDLLEKELGIPSTRVYIEFSDINASLWGWNRTTFG